MVPLEPDLTHNAVHAQPSDDSADLVEASALVIRST
jgi:hypothetical protein